LALFRKYFFSTFGSHFKGHFPLPIFPLLNLFSTYPTKVAQPNKTPKHHQLTTNQASPANLQQTTTYNYQPGKPKQPPTNTNH
jgi:hypothetical protein